MQTLTIRMLAEAAQELFAAGRLQDAAALDRVAINALSDSGDLDPKLDGVEVVHRSIALQPLHWSPKSSLAALEIVGQTDIVRAGPGLTRCNIALISAFLAARAGEVDKSKAFYESVLEDAHASPDQVFDAQLGVVSLHIAQGAFQAATTTISLYWSDFGEIGSWMHKILAAHTIESMRPNASETWMNDLRLSTVRRRCSAALGVDHPITRFSAISAASISGREGHWPRLPQSLRLAMDAAASSRAYLDTLSAVNCCRWGALLQHRQPASRYAQFYGKLWMSRWHPRIKEASSILAAIGDFNGLAHRLYCLGEQDAAHLVLQQTAIHFGKATMSDKAAERLMLPFAHLLV